MSILQQVTSGVSNSGIRMVISGQEKMGKTTMCSMAPTALLIPLEVGFAGVEVAKTPMLQTYAETLQLVDEITALAQQGRFPYKTIIFDSATALERQIHQYVLELDPTYKVGGKKMTTMESAHGGYGRAHSMANNFFDEFLKKLDVLAIYGGINILMTCHVFQSKVIDPTAGEFDSWDLLLHSPKNFKTYGKREMITQWADVIGFIYEPIYITQGEKSNVARGVSQNKGRVLAVSRTPSYVAGNRYGLIGEIPLPAPPQNSWNAFADVLYKAKGIDLFTR